MCTKYLHFKMNVSTSLLLVTVTVTVTKVFVYLFTRYRGRTHYTTTIQNKALKTAKTSYIILRFLLKDRKRITESFTYIQRSPVK